jgi:flagellar hook-length control protein FliK
VTGAAAASEVDPVAGFAAVTAAVTTAAPAADAASRTSSTMQPALPQRIAGQVAQHVAGLRTLQDGTHRTVLHLTPDHLGALTLTVDVRAGHVTLGVAGDQAALSTLRDGIGQLRDQLAASGLQLDDVSLQTATDSGRGRPDQQPFGTDLGGDRGNDRDSGRAARGDAGGDDGPAPARTTASTPVPPVSRPDQTRPDHARPDRGRLGRVDVRV